MMTEKKKVKIKPWGLEKIFWAFLRQRLVSKYSWEKKEPDAYI